MAQVGNNGSLSLPLLILSDTRHGHPLPLLVYILTLLYVVVALSPWQYQVV